MKIKNILRDNYSTIGIVLAIIVTTILSFNNIIPDKDAISYLLCADAGLAISVFLSSIKNDKTICTIMNRLEAQPISKKVTRKEHYQLLDTVAVNAKSEICIMTIDSALTSKVVSSVPEREIYYKTIETVVKTKREITIRRIYGLPIDESARKDKIKWIRSDLEKFKDCPNYHMRIFDWCKFALSPTPLSLQIVDDVFVGLVNMQHAATGVLGGGEDICIYDQSVVNHLKLYYDTIWEKCDELKAGDAISLEHLV